MNKDQHQRHLTENAAEDQNDRKRIVFISYCHKDQEFVDSLTSKLKEVRINDLPIDPWVDREDIEPGSDWRARIKNGVEKSNDFVFVISPDSIQSIWCLRELARALLNHKHLIPIRIKEVDDQIIPRQLRNLQWIDFPTQVDGFQQAFAKLKTAIKTDPDWVDAHSDLQTKAREWQSGRGDLLRGKSLEAAESLLAEAGPNKDPQPTNLQHQYVLASRKDATKRQRRSLTAISIALVLVIGLAIAAFIQRGIAVANEEKAQKAEATAVAEKDLKSTAQVDAQNSAKTAVAERDLKATAQVVAETQRDLAISRQLAAQARSMATNQFDLGLILAIEASRGSSDGILSLSGLLQAEPELVRVVSSPQGYIWQGADAGFIKSLALSIEGSQLVAEPEQGTPAAMFWDLMTGQSRPLDAEEYQRLLADWSAFQIPYPSLVSRQAEEQSLVPINTGAVKIILQTLEYNLFRGPSTAISNTASTRAAFSACLTQPAGGGAPGCSSRIYVFEKGYDPLISKLTSCSPTARPSDLCVELRDGKSCVKLDGGKFSISDAQNTANQPSDFELYSVALQNEATGIGSELTGVLYDPQHNWMITTAAVQRFGRKLALIVWDLEDKKQVFELFTPFWENSSATLNYSNKSGALDICGVDGTGIQVDLNPDSWREKACKIAGRNLTAVEWQQFLGDKPYRQTCPQWGPGD